MDKITTRRHLLRSAALTTLAAMAPRLADAATTLKALQLVVPTPPGSQPDLLARWLLEPLARRAGVPGSVINRPGAAGALAADAVLAAPADSGTLLLGGLDHVAYSHLNSQRRALDPFVDFVPVAAVNRDTWVVATGAEQPTRDFASLVQRGRGGDGLNYASTGEGSTAHLVTERLCQATGIKAQHVPYKDPWMPDLIGGRLQFVVAPVPAVLGPLRGQRLRALAVLSAERIPQLPEVPAIRELGWPEQVFHGGLYLFAPAALREQARSLNAWAAEALAQPDIGQRFRDAAVEPTPMGLDAVHESVRQRLALVDGLRREVFGRTR